MPETSDIRNPNSGVRPAGASALRDGLLVAASAVLIICAAIALQMFLPLSPLDATVKVEVLHGMTFRDAAEALAGAGLVRDPDFVVALGRMSGMHRRLRPGIYEFTGRLSPWSVYATLRDGRVSLWRVTITEGSEMRTIREKLAALELMEPAEFDRLATDSAFLNSLGIMGPSLEGYLYPDTYELPRGLAPEKLLKVMVDRLRMLYTSDMEKRAADMGMTENQVLALAAIVEKEAAVAGERPVISAVYHNRLTKGMPLQADPTVVYGIKPLGEPITKADLRRKTPYNTYMLKGLPPGPIGSPGIGAINAALYPADVPYIYFVANGDGTHTFTRTYREHMRAVRRYRAIKASEPGMKEASSDS